MTKTTRTLTLAAALALVATACGGSSDPEASETSAPPTTATAPTTTADLVPLETAVPPGVPPSDYAGFRAQPTACDSSPPAEATNTSFSEADDLALDPTIKLLATINTSCGSIVVELDPMEAPLTVNSFVFLAQQGYFDGTVSHRVLPGFVIQAGDPTATGRGGPGYVVPDELPSEGFSYSAGVLAMANAGPNSTGSQFFIMIGDSGLPPLYSAFGQVVDGFPTLETIAGIPLGTSARGETSVPLETIYIESVTVAPVN